MMILLVISAIISLANANPITKYYQIKDSNYEYKFISFESQTGVKYSVATHHWSSSTESNATIVTSHGYLDNCGYFLPLHKMLLKNNYDVICIDLLGHAATSGDRLDVDNFHSYTDSFQAVFEKLPKNKPLYFIGHSTGAVGIIDSLIYDQEIPFKKTILLAPLVRMAKYSLTYPFIKFLGQTPLKIPVMRLTKHPEYKAIKKRDPWIVNFMPINWAYQLIKWNNELEQQPNAVCDYPLYVLSGDQDSVVKTEFNREFLKKHFPNLTYIQYSNTDHHLIYEDARPQIFKKILAIIND